MSMTPDEVAGIARLARLEIAAEDIPAYTHNLTRILDFVAQLEGAETGGVEPMAHPLEGMVQRLRTDEVTESIDRARYQQDAPKVEDGVYLVPRVIE